MNLHIKNNPANPSDCLTLELLQVANGNSEPNLPAAGSVLLVGNPALPLKGFDVAIKALTTVNRVVPISLTWICQTQPTAANVPALVGSGLSIDLYISPKQVHTA